MLQTLVVDANVVISSLINKGVTSSVFTLNAFFEKFKFIAPEFLLEEVKKHKLKILKQTKLSEQEFEETYNFLINEITFVPATEFLHLLPKAKIIAPHDKDATYVALSLVSNCPIFSGDKGLISLEEVKVFSPRDLFNLLTKFL